MSQATSCFIPLSERQTRGMSPSLCGPEKVPVSPWLPPDSRSPACSLLLFSRLPLEPRLHNRFLRSVPAPLVLSTWASCVACSASCLIRCLYVSCTHFPFIHHLSASGTKDESDESAYRCFHPRSQEERRRRQKQYEASFRSEAELPPRNQTEHD